MSQQNVSSGPGEMSRRAALKSGLAAAASVTVGRYATYAGVPSEKVTAAVIGLGRGMQHIDALLNLPNVELKTVCDVDETRRIRAAKTLEAKGDAVKKLPEGVIDLRKVCDDPAIQAVFVATSNHWHAPATILACSAGKHVYVEKPGSHNPQEGAWMVAAAEKHKRLVQMGNQRRTWPAVREAIQKLKDGLIGDLKYARCWYNNERPTLGTGKPIDPPKTLDYEMWQGPAPRRAFKDNLVHYNWHWHWHWGNGELGNNGIHALDVARWGLGVEAPKRIAYVGGRYQHVDDQETPDTGSAQFDFGKVGISWEGSSCHARRADKLPFVAFYGTKGTLHIDGTGYKAFDPQGKSLGEETGEGGEQRHIGNFLDAIRTGAVLNSPIVEGQKSTLLCHLGNIAYRLGKTIDFDPAAGAITNAPEAAALWKREYHPDFEPKV